MRTQETRIYTTNQDGGDGSGSQKMFETLELAEWDEHFGAPEGFVIMDSVGWFDIEHEGPIFVKEVWTAKNLKVELEKYDVHLEYPERYEALLKIISTGSMWDNEK